MFNLRLPMLIALAAGAGCAPVGRAAPAEPSWSYAGADGPEHWAELGASFSACALGRTQSPIDLAEGQPSARPEYRFAYLAAVPRIRNNGHTVQVDVPPGSTVGVQGVPHALLQYHLHTPSEHTLSGETYPLELHLVHRGPAGFAVVGVLLREGAFNPAYAVLLENLPAAPGEEVTAPRELDPAALLGSAGSGHVFRYAGSLTTPPCTEGVEWHVLATPVEVSAMQIQQFRHVFEMNSRPVQPLLQRTVLDLTP